MRKWDFKNLDDGSAEVLIYDEIGAGWFGGLTAKAFAEELRALGDISELYVRINSPGGSVYEGLAIHQTLARHPARVIASIDGIAASIASIIPMAADTIEISANARMMIHRPWGITMGSSDDFRKDADQLDSSEETLINIYRERTEKDVDELRAMLAAETWFTATEAVEAGLADSIYGAEEKVAAAAMLGGWDLSRFKNAPAPLRNVGPPASREPVVDAYEEAKQAVDVRLRLVDLQQQNS